MGSGGSESPIEVFVGEVGEPPLGPVASSGLFPFPLCFGGLGVLDQPLLSIRRLAFCGFDVPVAPGRPFVSALGSRLLSHHVATIKKGCGGRGRSCYYVVGGVTMSVDEGTRLRCTKVLWEKAQSLLAKATSKDEEQALFTVERHLSVRFTDQ